MKRKFWNWIRNETDGERTLVLNGEISDETWFGDEVEEWLDGFNTFSIYQVLPQLIGLWGLNVKTDVDRF